MWVAIVIIVIALLLVLTAPKPNIENARAAKLGDFQIPRAKHGDPMPYLCGTRRQKSPILIWNGDYVPVPITKKMKTGLTSSKKVIVGYKNYMGLDLVLCLGTGVRIRKAWAGVKLFWSGNVSADSDITINQPGLFGGDDRQGGLAGVMRFYNGGFSPAQDPYLQSVIGVNVPAYNGLARVLFKGASGASPTGFYIGTQTSIQPFSFEVSRLPTGLHATYSIMPNGLDSNPWEICYDVIKGDWGKLGNINADIDTTSWVAAAQKCYNENLGISLLVQSAVSGKDILEECMRLADGLIYQEPSTKKLMAKLIRNDYDEATLDILDESVIKDVRNFAKTTWDNTFNQCRVMFSDRAKDYDESVAVAQDFANINYQQRIKSTEISAPGCCVADVANGQAARQLSFLNVPFFKCELVCNRKAAKYRPGDVIKLSFKKYRLVSMVMRVAKVRLGTLEDGAVTLTVVQDRYATATPVFAAPPGGGFTPINADAQPVATRRIFPAPWPLVRASGADTPATVASAGRLYVVANKPGSASYGFNVISSGDNFGSETVNSMDAAPYNGSGTLVAAIAAADGGVNRVLTNVVVTGLSLNAIAGLNNYSSIAQARDGSAMLLINNELFMYVGFTDNGGGQVTFSTVYREVLDTSAAAHAIGDRVWFINAADGLLPELNTNNVNRYVKLLDQTPASALDPSAAPTDTVLQTNRAALPLRPNYLTLQSSRAPGVQVAQNNVIAAWYARSRTANEVAAFNDNAHATESGVEYRVRYRLNAGSYTEIITSSMSAVIPVTGLTGTLEVLVDSRFVGTSTYSANADRLTVELAAGAMFRVNVSATETADTTFLTIAELEFRTTAGSSASDIATGGTALASSYFSANPPALAFDNSAATMYASDTSLAGPQWVGYMINSADATIAEVAITAGDAPHRAARAPKDFTIQKSVNGGASWTTLRTVTGSTGWAVGETRTFSVP